MLKSCALLMGLNVFIGCILRVAGRWKLLSGAVVVICSMHLRVLVNSEVCGGQGVPGTLDKDRESLWFELPDLSDSISAFKGSRYLCEPDTAMSIMKVSDS